MSNFALAACSTLCCSLLAFRSAQQLKHSLYADVRAEVLGSEAEAAAAAGSSSSSSAAAGSLLTASQVLARSPSSRRSLSQQRRFSLAQPPSSQRSAAAAGLLRLWVLLALAQCAVLLGLPSAQLLRAALAVLALVPAAAPLLDGLFQQGLQPLLAAALPHAGAVASAALRTAAAPALPALRSSLFSAARACLPCVAEAQAAEYSAGLAAAAEQCEAELALRRARAAAELAGSSSGGSAGSPVRRAATW